MNTHSSHNPMIWSMTFFNGSVGNDTVFSVAVCLSENGRGESRQALLSIVSSDVGHGTDHEPKISPPGSDA